MGKLYRMWNDYYLVENGGITRYYNNGKKQSLLFDAELLEEFYNDYKGVNLVYKPAIVLVYQTAIKHNGNVELLRKVNAEEFEKEFFGDDPIIKQDARPLYEEQKKRQQEIDIQNAEAKRVKEEELKQKEQQEIADGEQKFRNGDKITTEMFLKLCKKYNIAVPIKTIGWLNKSVYLVYDKGYECKRGSNKSTVIFSYIRTLKEAI
jgi:hypothetical protein